MTNEPIDEFTEDVARQIVAVKNDPIVRRDFMVLQAELRDTEIIAFEAGEAKGHAAGLAEGEARVHVDIALEMLKDKKPLNEIIKYSKLPEVDIESLAEQHGFAVVRA